VDLKMPIKAILFDMDGVLIDARDWHYLALNEALAPFGFEISRGDHLARFNGLSTSVKLKILSEESGFPYGLHEIVNDVKQDRTLRLAGQLCFPNIGHQILLSRIKSKGIKIGVVTNSIRNSAEMLLSHAQIFQFLDALVTNQDVKYPKPDSEGYLLACQKLGVAPQEVIVVEDGEYGMEAARKAGCIVLQVGSPDDVCLELFSESLPVLFEE